MSAELSTSGDDFSVNGGKITDLADGVSAQDAATVSQVTGATPTGTPADGWVNDTADTWTYASGSGGGTATFTVAGDQTAKFIIGTRIKLTQTTAKYFNVIGSAFAAGTTTVTITAGTSYTLANAAISANYHSYALCPQGWPTWFNFAPAATGFTGAVTTVYAKFRLLGSVCQLRWGISGTSNATTFTFTAPIAFAGDIDAYGYGRVTNSGTVQAGPGRAIIAGTTVTLTRDLTGTTWTNSGTKGFGGGMLDYDIA